MIYRKSHLSKNHPAQPPHNVAQPPVVQGTRGAWPQNHSQFHAFASVIKKSRVVFNKFPKTTGNETKQTAADPILFPVWSVRTPPLPFLSLIFVGINGFAQFWEWDGGGGGHQNH